MKNMKRSVALLVAIALLIGCAAGGTMAWLTMKTQDVVNTFTVGDINITLTESDADVDIDGDGDIDADDKKDDINNNSYKMVPGATIAKDPKVTVNANSEACYLFVKIEQSANYTTYLKDYIVDTGDGKWKALDGADGVYYRQVDATNADTSFYVLKGEGTDDYQYGYVEVKGEVEKTDMKPIDGKDDNGTALTGTALTAEISARPTLTFTAYAVQQSGFATAGDAWTEASSL